MNNKKIFLILFLLINFVLLGRYFFRWVSWWYTWFASSLSDDQKRSLFLSADYDGYLDNVSVRERDPDLRYWRVLAHIYNADLEQARSEFTQLDFSLYSKTSIDLFQALMLLEKDPTQAIRYINTMDIPFNLRERWAKDQLYAVALLQNNAKVSQIKVAQSQVKQNVSQSRLTNLLDAAALWLQNKHQIAYDMFTTLDATQSIDEPLFQYYFGRAAYHIGDRKTAKDILEPLSVDSGTKDGYFSIDEYQIANIMHRTYAALEDPTRSILSIDTILKSTTLTPAQLSNLYIARAANLSALGRHDQAWEYLVEALSHVEKSTSALNSMIRTLSMSPNTDNKQFLQSYIQQYIDEFDAKTLFGFLRSRDEGWDVDEALRLQRFILAKFPGYNPVRDLERKQLVEKYVLYRLAGDTYSMDQTEVQMYEILWDDSAMKLVFAMKAMEDGDLDLALRFGQEFANNITIEQLQLYRIVFLWYLQQWSAQWYWSTYLSDTYLTEYAPSELDQKLMTRRLALQLDDWEILSQTTFEIEALRGESESMDADEIEQLFQQQFRRYFNYWDQYFAPDEVDEELDET